MKFSPALMRGFIVGGLVALVFVFYKLMTVPLPADSAFPSDPRPVLDPDHHRVLAEWAKIDRKTQLEVQEWIRRTAGLPDNCLFKILSLSDGKAIHKDGNVMGFVVIGTPANEKPYLPVRTLAFRWEPDNERQTLRIGPVTTNYPVEVTKFFKPIAEAVGKEVLSYAGMTEDGQTIILVTRPLTAPIIDEKAVHVWFGKTGQPLRQVPVKKIELQVPNPRLVITTAEGTLNWEPDADLGRTTYGQYQLFPFPEAIDLLVNGKQHHIVYRTPVPKAEDNVRVKLDGKDVSQVNHQ